MPRYFFHSEDGHIAHDAIGTDLPDMSAARVEAVQRAGKLLVARPQEFWETQFWRMLVAAEDGRILFTIEVSTAIGVNVMPRPRVLAG